MSVQEQKGQTSQKIFWGVVIILIVVIIFGIIKLSKQGTNTSSDPFEITANDHLKGNKNAPVTLIEYSDFQCPACASYFPFIKKLEQDFPDNLRIVYRHFPLTSIHPYAVTAAKAAEAADQQGRFWEMHDIIFQNQTKWSQEPNPEKTFESYAELLNLDMNKYKEDFNSNIIQRKINSDRAQALRLNLQGTPSFFLDGNKLENLRNYDALKELIKKEIEEKTGTSLPTSENDSTMTENTDTTTTEPNTTTQPEEK